MSGGCCWLLSSIPTEGTFFLVNLIFLHLIVATLHSRNTDIAVEWFRPVRCKTIQIYGIEHSPGLNPLFLYHA